VFLPLLILSVAARAGVVEPGPNLAWVASWPALVALSTAATVEVAGYYIPWVDHALDVLATPLAAAGGALAALVTMMPADSALSGWSWGPMLATGAGGAITAGGVQLATVAARAASTVTTGGVGNPIVATLENIGATMLSIMSIIAPIVGVVLLLCAFLLARRWFFRRSASEARGPKHGIGPVPVPGFVASPKRRSLIWRALGVVGYLAPWRWTSRRPWRRSPTAMA
jgi:hypothetical protein